MLVLWKKSTGKRTELWIRKFKKFFISVGGSEDACDTETDDSDTDSDDTDEAEWANQDLIVILFPFLTNSWFYFWTMSVHKIALFNKVYEHFLEYWLSIAYI